MGMVKRALMELSEQMGFDGEITPEVEQEYVDRMALYTDKYLDEMKEKCLNG